MAREGLQALGEKHTSKASLAKLGECFALLPSHARILFLGAMMPRGTGVVRVVASGLSLQDMLIYLQRLGLRRAVGNLEVISDLSKRTESMWLAIDIQDTEVAPRNWYRFLLRQLCSFSEQPEVGRCADLSCWQGHLLYC